MFSAVIRDASVASGDVAVSAFDKRLSLIPTDPRGVALADEVGGAGDSIGGAGE